MSEAAGLSQRAAPAPHAAYPTVTLDDCIVPDWRVAARVGALLTTRAGGVSEPPFGRFEATAASAGAACAGGLNLGMYVGDEPLHVVQNRSRLARLVPGRIAWLRQVHGNAVVTAAAVLAQADAPAPMAGCEISADACVTDQPGQVCAILTADCLPVLLADSQGRAVGAAHAGWRGLLDGVLEHAVLALQGLAPGGTQSAFLGPAIGPGAFEVGADVRDAFADSALPAERDATAAAFSAGRVTHPLLGHPGPLAPGKFLADLPALARLRLRRVGIVEVAGGDLCTVTDRRRFYSYRRDRATGRMAALIWLDDARSARNT